MNGTRRPRLDHLRENTPQRTFTANARLLALPPGDDDIDELETCLDTLCSVFDPIDGPCYEIEGERFRDRGLLDRTADNRARSALDRFRIRSIATHTKVLHDRVCAAARKFRCELGSDAPIIRPNAVMTVVDALDDDAIPGAGGADVVAGSTPAAVGRPGARRRLRYLWNNCSIHGDRDSDTAQQQLTTTMFVDDHSSRAVVLLKPIDEFVVGC